MLVTPTPEGVMGPWRPELAECGAVTGGEPGSSWGGELQGTAVAPPSWSGLLPVLQRPQRLLSPSARAGAGVLAAPPMSDPPGV